jgi:hypothetical protein
MGTQRGTTVSVFGPLKGLAFLAQQSVAAVVHSRTLDAFAGVLVSPPWYAAADELWAEAGERLAEEEAEMEVVEPYDDDPIADCHVPNPDDFLTPSQILDALRRQREEQVRAEAFGSITGVSTSVEGSPFLGSAWQLRAEPPLTPDEIVAVRQLIEERFPLTSPTSGESPDPGVGEPHQFGY